MQLMAKPTHLIGDCLGVVRSLDKMGHDPSPSGVHDGLLKAVTKDSRMTNLKVSWMASHQSLGGGASEEQKLWHAGNAEVDRAAGEAWEVVENLVGLNY